MLRNEVLYMQLKVQFFKLQKGSLSQITLSVRNILFTASDQI